MQPYLQPRRTKSYRHKNQILSAEDLVLQTVRFDCVFQQEQLHELEGVKMHKYATDRVGTGRCFRGLDRCHKSTVGAVTNETLP